MSIEAMKHALEALETYHGYMEPLLTVFGGPRVPAEQSTTGKVEKAITALRTAIEQAERQEPVAYEYDYSGNERPLYTTPPAEQRQWVGLTDEEIILMSGYDLNYASLIGEVQRKLKEKNT